MPELIVPTVRLRESWRTARAEYGVRPTGRGRGLATWAIGQVLPRARERGLDRVLITCADTNLASARAIERNGGVLEDIRETEFGLTRRYWIDLRADAD